MILGYNQQGGEPDVSQFKQVEVVKEDESERERSYQDNSLRQSNNDRQQTGEDYQEMIASDNMEGNFNSGEREDEADDQYQEEHVVSIGMKEEFGDNGEEIYNAGLSPQINNQVHQFEDQVSEPDSASNAGLEQISEAPEYKGENQISHDHLKEQHVNISDTGHPNQTPQEMFEHLEMINESDLKSSTYADLIDLGSAQSKPNSAIQEVPNV